MAHMVWGKGGLLNASLGGRFPTLDFAGGTVVHVTSGVSALWSPALYLGKRIGYPRTSPCPRTRSCSASSAPACSGSAGSASTPAPPSAAGTLATSAFVATHFGAAAAACGWSAAEWIRNGKPSALGAISGAVAGLVGITPAAGFVTPISALWIGLITGIFCFFMVVTVKNLFGYDDSLDAFGVHGAGGTIGAILTGLFANSAINPIFGAGKATGVFEGNPTSSSTSSPASPSPGPCPSSAPSSSSFIVDKTIGLRVSRRRRDAKASDISHHGEEGYDFAA